MAVSHSFFDFHPENRYIKAMSTTKHIIEELKKELHAVTSDAAFKNVGTVTEVKDGIARISGLS